MRNALIFAAFMFGTVNVWGEIPWNTDLKVAHQKAEAEGKLLLVHFESDNCVWCDKLEAGAFQSPEVAGAIGQQFVPVKINASSNKKLAEYFKVTRFPTDVIVDATGIVHSHQISPQLVGQYVAMLQQAAKKGGKSLETPAAAIAQQPAPPQAAESLAATQPNIGEQPTAAPVQNLQVPVSPSPAPAPAQVASGYAMPPESAPVSQQPGGQFQLPSYPSAQPPSANMAAVGVQMPPSAPIRVNDGGAGSISQNNFALPGSATPAADDVAAGQISSPASVGQSNIAEPADAPQPPTQSEELPPRAMDGYCAVAIQDEMKWIAGKKEFGAIHLGKLYLFSSADAQQKFLDQPEIYTPALGGLDVVRFIEGQEQVEGIREFGLHHEGQIYFFADEMTLNRFFHSPQAYTVQARSIMRQATSQMRDSMIR
ncbi:MAG: DUF255 domain-containing protein [Pirellulaceae bacterium]